jgi:hypothetical protein
MQLALSAADLPFQIGLDWSHDTWKIAGGRKAGFPTWDNNRVLVNVVVGTGSIVSHDAIPAAQLRVCPKNNPKSDIACWPKLTDVARADVFETPPAARIF